MNFFYACILVLSLAGLTGCSELVLDSSSDKAQPVLGTPLPHSDSSSQSNKNQLSALETALCQRPGIRCSRQDKKLQIQLLTQNAFLHNSALFRPDFVPTLKALASEMLLAPSLKFRIEGSFYGQASFQRQLGENRALALATFLIQSGVDSLRLHTAARQDTDLEYSLILSTFF